MEILKHITPNQWRHVKTAENPADFISRGLHPLDIKDCHLWVYGPRYLYGSDRQWNMEFQSLKSAETKPTEASATKLPSHIAAISTTTHSTMSIIYTIDSRNSFRHLQRVLAYVLRFINSAKDRRKRQEHIQLSSTELDHALIVIMNRFRNRHSMRKSSSFNGMGRHLVSVYYLS